MNTNEPGDSGYLVEVSAPGNPEALDRFVARSAAFAARWVKWALTERELSRTLTLVELAFEGRLVARVSPFRGDQLAEPVRLDKWIALAGESGPPSRLTSTTSLRALKRRLEQRPEEGVTFEVDVRGVTDGLPPLATPPLAREAMARLAGVGVLPVGATLVDASEAVEDPDPQVYRPVEVPAAALPLFDAVYADLENDSLRSVLADALEEAGHPRGRFIQLQLARARSGELAGRDETWLLVQHEDEWLGDLKRVVRDVRWERGFPVAARIQERLPGLFARPELTTLERLHLAGFPRDKVLALEKLPLLRELTGVEGVDMTRLAAHPFERLASLHCDARELIQGGQPQPELLELVSTRGLPALRRLELDQGILEEANGGKLLGGDGRPIGARDFAWLWRTPLAAQLERFGTQVTFAGLRSWLELVPKLPVPVIELRVCQYLDFEVLWLRLTRGSKEIEAFWREVPPQYDDKRPTVQLLLEAMRGTGVSLVRLEHPRAKENETALAGDSLEFCVPGVLRGFEPLARRRRP